MLLLTRWKLLQQLMLLILSIFWYMMQCNLLSEGTYKIVWSGT